jgi:Common central domain of tyrosinase/Polyphenol oxidase middle domain
MLREFQMKFSRREACAGGAMVAAAALFPFRSRAVGIVHVRRSLADLMRENSPSIESYRRAVDVMMARSVTDKTSWLFQANMVGVAAREIAGETLPLAKYWRQSPRKNYLFLAWQRMHLHYFERIVRRASGDPAFALPYWAYEDPRQLQLPEPFRPGSDQLETPVSRRRNALARSFRDASFERGVGALADMSKEFEAALRLDHFIAADPLDPGGGFGGVRVGDVSASGSPGAAEALHNRFHLSIGRDGDLASPTTAARDPVYWLHAANIDRLWAQWTARGGAAPVDDSVWMKTSFTFVDENGDDRVMSGADVLDTQLQLGYRYDNEPRREQSLTIKSPAIAPSVPEPVVFARAAAVELSARETAVVFGAVAPPRRSSSKAVKAAPTPRTRLVLRHVTAADRSPPYDLFLVLEGTNVFEPTTTSQRIGTLEIFGGVGRGDDGRKADEAIVVFDVTEAMAKLSKARGFSLRHLRLAIVRRPAGDTAGARDTPPDPTPPEIGAIELVRS